MEHHCLHVLLVVISLLVVMPLAFSCPTGAPAAACTSLTPNHGVSGQAANTLPYTINTAVFSDPNTGELLYTAGFTYNSKLFTTVMKTQHSVCPDVHVYD